MRHYRPPLTADQILAWADAHKARTGRWPHRESGPIPNSQGDTWGAVGMALFQGGRGLPGGDTLARFLARHRDAPHPSEHPHLSVKQILCWADEYRRLTGRWPTMNSGPIASQGTLTWKAVDSDLKKGCRGLPGGTSLARLLAEKRGARNLTSLPRLTVEQILDWADRHHARTGAWPVQGSGPVAGSGGETWLAVDRRLRRGGRGLPGGSSLPRLLAEARGVRNIGSLPPLTEKQILAWARAHRRRTGDWPRYDSGQVVEAPGETWGGINMALTQGHRGFQGGSNLSQLLAKKKRTGKRENR